MLIPLIIRNTLKKYYLIHVAIRNHRCSGDKVFTEVENHCPSGSGLAKKFRFEVSYTVKKKETSCFAAALGQCFAMEATLLSSRHFTITPQLFATKPVKVAGTVAVARFLRERRQYRKKVESYSIEKELEILLLLIMLLLPYK